ncbi:uncharacterized protein PAE49_004873 [Odontesthes bonariensis]|uniref:uncharacterized protein LOC142379876 n=1 Tax=Odontesthes bonariensis TaxID=219752 RepID=UPI003F58BF04
MLLFTLVLGVWLLPKGETLTCYECLPGYSGLCLKIATCPSQNHQCASFRIMSYAGGSKFSDIQTKTCALAQECGEHSLNLGVYKDVITTKCCNSDLCNTQSAPADASKFSPNGKKCFTCEGQTCTKTLNCEGNEDHCISATVNANGNMITTKGCASAQICSASTAAKYKAASGLKLSCCQGDLCNSASRKTLTCLECLPGYSGLCLKIATCPSQNHQCASFRIMSYKGGSKVEDDEAKTCALAQECGEHFLNFGAAKTLITTKCCNSDLCNTQSAPADASKFSPNGKKCFTCEGQTCTKTLNCEGNEDRCVSATSIVDGNTITRKGCASEQMCSASTAAKYKAASGEELSCCQGDLCNSAGRKTLTCLECLPGYSGLCLKIATCPSQNHQCASFRIMSYKGGSKVEDDEAKTCALAQECGEHFLNFGAAKTLITTKCCNSDLCNTQSAPADASKFSPNGKKCFTCEGQTCTKTLNCEGNEDRCVSATSIVDGNTITRKGCASEQMCSASTAAKYKAASGEELSCCQGDLCNSAGRETLTCYECLPGDSEPCKESKKCPSQNHQCGSFRIMSYKGGSKVEDDEAKSCALAQECGEHFLNFGAVKTLITTKCCNSDLCNTQSAPADASKFSPNGKKCFTCEGQTCTKTLNCEGNEDRCVSGTSIVDGNTITRKGCASEQMCSASTAAKYKAVSGEELSCCQGDLCNSAGSTSAGLPLMAVPLISLVLLS